MPAVRIIACRGADDLDIVFTAVLKSRLGISDRSKARCVTHAFCGSWLILLRTVVFQLFSLHSFHIWRHRCLPRTAKCSLWFDILFYEFAQLAGPVGQTVDEPTSEYLILFRSVYV